MKLKNVLIAVTDIEKSKKFYHDLFELEVLLDSGENVIRFYDPDGTLIEVGETR